MQLVIHLGRRIFRPGGHEIFLVPRGVAGADAEFKPAHAPKGSPKGGQFVSKGGGGSGSPQTKKATPEPPARPAGHPGGGGELSKTSKRAWTGHGNPNATRLGKQEAGKLGEEIALNYVRQVMGLTDAVPLNSKVNNYAADMIGDHEVYEIKTGQTGVSRGAAQWRATIGEPGAAEKAAMKNMTPEQLAAHNERKNQMIMERKAAALAEQSKRIGHPVKAKTIALIIDPDTGVADVHEFDGFHKRIGYNSPGTAQAYRGSFEFKTQKPRGDDARGAGSGDVDRDRTADRPVHRRLEAGDHRTLCEACAAEAQTLDAPEWKESQHPRGQPGNKGQFGPGGAGGGGKSAKPHPSGEPEEKKPEPEKPETKTAAPPEARQAMLKYGFRQGYEVKGVVSFTNAQGDHIEIYPAAPGEEHEWSLIGDRVPTPTNFVEGKGVSSLLAALDQHGYKQRANRVSTEMTEPLKDLGFRVTHEDDDTGLVTLTNRRGGTAEIEPPDPETGQSKWRLDYAGEHYEGEGQTGISGIANAIKEAAAEEDRKLLVKTCRDQAVKLGFDPDDILFTDEEYSFELNGQKCYAAGTAHISPSDSDYGKIKIYNKQANAVFATGLISHEIMHHKFQQMYDEYRKEQQHISMLEEQRERAGEPSIRSWSEGHWGEITDPALKQRFQFYSALQPFLNDPHIQEKLIKEDGVTSYSRNWWQEYKDQKATFMQAAHETLAEMNSLRYTKDDPDGKGPWKDLYQRVVVDWWKLPAAAERRKAALRARRQGKKEAA